MRVVRHRLAATPLSVAILASVRWVRPACADTPPDEHVRVRPLLPLDRHSRDENTCERRIVGASKFTKCLPMGTSMNRLLRARGSFVICTALLVSACTEHPTAATSPADVAPATAAITTRLAAPSRQPEFVVEGRTLRRLADNKRVAVSAPLLKLVAQHNAQRDEFDALQECLQRRGCIPRRPARAAMSDNGAAPRTSSVFGVGGTLAASSGYNCADGAMAIIGATAEYREAERAVDDAIAGMFTSAVLLDPPSPQDFVLLGNAYAHEQTLYLQLSIMAWEYRAYGCA